jgi:hypothetical protein
LQDVDLPTTSNLFLFEDAPHSATNEQLPADASHKDILESPANNQSTILQDAAIQNLAKHLPHLQIAVIAASQWLGAIDMP